MVNATAPATPTSMATFGRRLRTAVYLGVIVCVLVARVTGMPAFESVLSTLSLAAVLISLPVATRMARTIGIAFLAAGGFLLWFGGGGLNAFVQSFGQMAYVLGLFAVLPVLAAPIRLGGYSNAIENLLQTRVRRVFSLNCIATSLAYLCGSVVSPAAIPIMMASMRPAVTRLPPENRQRFIAISAISGYVLPLYWTPVSGVVGIVLDSLRLEWMALFPMLFLLSLVCLPVNWVVFRLAEGRSINEKGLADHDGSGSDPSSPVPLLLQMAAAILALVTSIVLLEHGLRIGVMNTVTLLAIPAAFVWCVALGQGKGFMRSLGGDFMARIPGLSDSCVVFLCAGFLGTAIGLSGADQYINAAVLRASAQTGPLLFLLLMPVMTLAASFIGMHPLVTIALLGSVLSPEILGVSATQLALSLIGSTVIAFMLGPFTGTLGLVQTLSKTSVFRLAWWSAPYGLGYFCVLCAFIVMS